MHGGGGHIYKGLNLCDSPLLSGFHIRAIKQVGSKQYEEIVLSDSDSDTVIEVSVRRAVKRPSPSVSSHRSDQTDSDSQSQQQRSPSSLLVVSSTSSSQSQSSQESGMVLDPAEMLSDKELRKEIKKRQAEVNRICFD